MRGVFRNGETPRAVGMASEVAPRSEYGGDILVHESRSGLRESPKDRKFRPPGRSAGSKRSVAGRSVRLGESFHCTPRFCSTAAVAGEHAGALFGTKSDLLTRYLRILPDFFSRCRKCATFRRGTCSGLASPSCPKTGSEPLPRRRAETGVREAPAGKSKLRDARRSELNTGRLNACRAPPPWSSPGAAASDGNCPTCRPRSCSRDPGVRDLRRVASLRRKTSERPSPRSLSRAAASSATRRVRAARLRRPAAMASFPELEDEDV